MTRTALLALIAWTLLLCAPIHAGYADTSTATAANTNLEATSPSSGDQATDARLTQLAQRLAAEPPTSTDPTRPADQGHANDSATGSAGTPLVTGTPLIRRGLSSDTDDQNELPGTTSWMLKTLTALGLVVGLALLARQVYARLGGKVASASSPVVEVLSRTTVAPRSHVMLLRVGGRVLVVSESSAGMRTLTSVDDAEEVADLLGAVSASRPTSISRGFSQLFNRFNEDYEQESDGQEKTDDPDRRLGRTHKSVSGLLSRMRGMGREGGAP